MASILRIIVFIHLITAEIFVKQSINNLQYLVNEIIESADCQKKLIYVIDTPVRIVNYPVVLFDKKTNMDRRFHFCPDVYVIGKNISDTLDVLYISFALNSKSLFVLVVDQINNSVLQMIDRYYIFKVVFLKNLNHSNSYELCTLHTKKLAAKNSTLSLPFCQRVNKVNKFKKIHTDLDNMSIVKKFNEVNILYDIYPPYTTISGGGIHLNFIKIIGHSLKLKTNFIKTNQPTHPTRIPEEFMDNSSYDIFVTLTINRLFENMPVDKTEEISDDTVIFLAPVIIRDGFWNVLYGEYETAVWIYFLVSTVIFYLAFYIVGHILQQDKNASTGLLILSILLQGSTSVQTKSRSFSTLFVVYLMFALIFTTAYKSKMFDIMRVNTSYNVLKTPSDLFKYKIKLGLWNTLIATQEYQHALDPSEQIFIDSNATVYCYEGFFECIRRVASVKEFFISVPLRIAQLFVSEIFVGSDNKPMVNAIKKTYQSMLHFVFVFRKGHPLRDLFNHRIRILKESGLTEYEYIKYKQRYEKAKFLNNRDKELSYKPLDIRSVQVIFYIYVICILMSVVTFCTELAVNLRFGQ
ncbi:Ionotropic receptor 125 [Diabrotica virgifera virgifera]|nr:Ionotropic receptor 125 [Diabrotica virgifera virgifera]